mgnify:CR=1
MEQKYRVELESAERQRLKQLTRKGAQKARVMRRAEVLLRADTNGPKPSSHRAIMLALEMSSSTVVEICRRYVEEGLDVALGERPRPGQAPKITGEVEAKLISLACSEPPPGRVRWTVRLLANELVRLEYVDGLSHVAVSKALKKMKLSLGK